MKNFFAQFVNSSLSKSTRTEIISNEKFDNKKVEFARKVISDLQHDIVTFTQNGSGPFVAAIYDDKNNLIIKTSNSVVNEICSHNHAEINAIKEVEKILGTYDLSPYNLSLYITAEPCMMCIGAIMWSGIKQVFYGVPSTTVEEVTGFDEGFKPEWFEEFKKRGIVVYGNIEPELGKRELQNYMQNGNKIYKPIR